MEEKDIGIWCGLCGKKIVSLADLKKAKSGKISFMDRGRMKFIRMMANLSGTKTYNDVHTFAMAKIHHHMIKKHKKEIEKEVKNNNGEKLWEWIKIKGEKELEALGVHINE